MIYPLTLHMQTVAFANMVLSGTQSSNLMDSEPQSRTYGMGDKLFSGPGYFSEFHSPSIANNMLNQ